MSEEEKDKEKKEKDAIDVNVALVIAERDNYKKLSEDLAFQLDAMTKKYEGAKALIEEDSKAALIKEIAPLCKLPPEMLALKTVDELEAWKHVLQHAKVAAFKSGTPVKAVDASPEAKLANMYDDYKAKTWGRNK